jgi:hypothetical protein
MEQRVFDVPPINGEHLHLVARHRARPARARQPTPDRFADGS